MTSIDDLPVQILLKIFNHFYWKPSVLDTISEFSKKLGLFVEDYKRYGNYYGMHLPDDNTKIGQLEQNGEFVHIRIGNLTPLTFPEILLKLELLGIIQLQDYNNLAEKLVNLRNLKISWLNLEVVGNPTAWTTFPELRELELGGPSHQLARNNIPQRLDILGNTKQGANNLGGLMALLCRTHFPKLKSLGLSIIFDPAQENLLVNSILTFLSKHQKTLKTLWCLMAADLNASEHGFLKQDWTLIPDYESRLEKLSLNLDHFILHFYPYVEAQNFLQLIDRISSTQSNIQSHVMLYPRYETFYTNILEDNFRTLTHVAISLWIFDILDCQVFEQCTALQSILLHARPKKLVEFETENYRGGPAHSELTNIHCLPKSLTSIEVLHFYIETKDTLLFSTEFPALVTLCLDWIGEKEELGCSLDMVSGLMHRQLPIIRIYRGFNRRLMEVNKSDDPATTLVKLTWLSAWRRMGKDHVWSLSGTKFSTVDEPILEDQSYRETFPSSAIPYQFLGINLYSTFLDGLFPALES